MGFRGFLAVYLTIVIGAATLITVMAPRLQIRNEIISSNHFSVRWMGFSPTDYNNSYPEYTVCINNLKDNPLKMQIAFQIKNQEAQGYYFLIDGYSAPAGWAFDPCQIGYINVDETKAFVYENVTRIVPSAILQGRLTETITLVVKAFYNNTYTNLYSQDNLDVTFNFLDRLSSAWTILYNDTFDDQTCEGWTSTGGFWYDPWGGSAGISLGPASDYYRSFQYSLKLASWASNYGSATCGYKKVFQIPEVSEAYLLFALRSSNLNYFSESGIMINGTTYFKADVIPQVGKWYQFAIPMQVNSTNLVEIWMTTLEAGYAQSFGSVSYLDDAFVIAK